MSQLEFTSIPVRPDTRDRIKSLKRGGEPYDELIRRLADSYEGN